MEKITTAKIMKDLIEEKEFFIYPHKKVNDLYDILLYKQIWLNNYYISFKDTSYLFSNQEYQKSLIYNQYSEIKEKNRFKKAYLYFVILTNQYLEQNILNQLKNLSSWIELEEINVNIILLETTKMEVLYSSESYRDKENLVTYFKCRSSLIHEGFEEINLLDVEKSTRVKKGYYLTQGAGYFTKLFMALNIIYFIYMTIQGGTTDVYNLIRFGAKYNPLIASGEYYRLFTNMFIHIGVIHLILNTYALKILGRDSEAIFGPFKFCIIYLISGILGGLGSLIFSDAVSAGASGAIFGLMGSYLYFGIKKPLIFSARYGMNLITLLIINIIFGLSNGSIDNFAHFGGLVGGFLTSWSLGLRDERIFTIKQILKQALIVLLIFVLLFVGVQKNQASWEYNLHSGIKYFQEEDLERSKSQFEIGIEKNSNISDFYFYMALIYYYEGNYQKAIDELNKTLHLNPNYPMARELLNEIKGK